MQVGRADQSCGAVVWPPLHCGVCDGTMIWELAIALAREAAADGEVPVGAVVLAADGPSDWPRAEPA